MGAAPGEFRDAAAQGTDHVEESCGDGAVPQPPDGSSGRQSLGRGVDPVGHERTVPILLFAACQRSRGPRGQPQGHRAHADLRTHGVGKNRADRLFDRDAGTAGGNASRVRQGSRSGNTRARPGRRLLPAPGRRADRIQPATTSADAGQRRIPEGLVERVERLEFAAGRSGTFGPSAGRPRSGVARHLGARCAGPSLVEARRISGSHGSGGPARTLVEVERGVPRRLRVGIR